MKQFRYEGPIDEFNDYVEQFFRFEYAVKTRKGDVQVVAAPGWTIITG